MGILPAAVAKIKLDLDLSDSKFGWLGGVDYVGQVLGSLLASMLIGSCNEKYLLTVCMIINIGVIILFTSTNVFAILLICRTITGLL